MVRSSSILFFSTVLLSCTDDNFPEGLYDYQVVRLLSNETTKTWQLLNTEPESCDSTYYYEMSNQVDSIGVAGIRWNCQSGDYTDTIFIDHATPSSLGLTFSDSLIFDDKTYWIVDEVTSTSLKIRQYPGEHHVRLVSLDQ